MIKTDYFLEILNGGNVTPSVISLAILAWYLIKEAHRANLRWFDWFHLPDNMSFILAVFIFDSGVVLKAFIVWAWRYTGGGPFNMYLTSGLIISGMLTIFGSLCKIRAMTEPNYGGRPWVQSLFASLIGIGLLLFI